MHKQKNTQTKHQKLRKETPPMKQIKLNTVKFILELMDNVNNIWQDEIIKNDKIVPAETWDTAKSIENRMDDFDETPLLVRIRYLGSEFYPSTQGFSFELLGSKKILTFETFVTKPKTMQEFKQFLSQCLEEIRMIPNTESPLNTVIINAFHKQHMPVEDLETVLNIKNQLLDTKDLNTPVFSYPNLKNDH